MCEWIKKHTKLVGIIATITFLGVVAVSIFAAVGGGNNATDNDGMLSQHSDAVEIDPTVNLFVSSGTGWIVIGILIFLLCGSTGVLTHCHVVKPRLSRRRERVIELKEMKQRATDDAVTLANLIKRTSILEEKMEKIRLPEFSNQYMQIPPARVQSYIGQRALPRPPVEDLV